MIKQALTLTALATMLALAGWQCTEQAKDAAAPPAKDTVSVTDTTADSLPQAVDNERFVFEPTLDTPEELARDRRTLYSWYPQHSKRLDFVLQGVSQINFLQDLGFDTIETILPRVGKGGYPIGNSVRLKLAGEKTALAFKFLIDTLPGPRVQGEGRLGLFAVHCGDMFGMNIELPRVHASTGRFDLNFNREYLMAQLSCCELPPNFWMAQYGMYGDTLAIVITFDTKLKKHMILLMGPRGARAFAGHYYCKFRTERGEAHRSETEYPYYCECEDPTWINLFLGNSWRGRKHLMEPVLRVRMY